MDSESSYANIHSTVDLDSACWKMLIESTMNLGETSVFNICLMTT